MIAGGLKGHIGIEDMERRALAGGEGAYTDLVDEELPPLERVYARVRSNEEEVRGAKIVERSTEIGQQLVLAVEGRDQLSQV